MRDIAAMYHYVRVDRGLNAFPPDEFEEQVERLMQTYEIVTTSEFLLDSDAPRCVLTFDDGLKDGHRNAMPVLEKLGVKATFFVPTCIFVRREVVPAQKRALLLRKIGPDQLIEEFNELAPAYCRIRDGVAMDEYNEPRTSLLKYLLDHMDQGESRRIMSTIFARYFDEPEVFDDLYLSIAELREMIGLGHEIGSHGHDHQWLGNLYTQDQLTDLSASVDLFKAKLGIHPRFMSYPFGSRNPMTLLLLDHLGFEAAFLDPTSATESGSPFELNRFDCIDLRNDKLPHPLARRTRVK
jgi:peptidoglycan/xylan/chitin deacetylase (PgdA/CDA1 family)